MGTGLLRRRLLGLLAGAWLGAAPVWVQAQAPAAQGTEPPPERIGRPFRPLFGPDGASRQSLHSIDLSLNGNAALDNAPFSGGSGAAVTDGTLRDAYTGGATLSYARRGGMVQLGASVGTTVPYYPDLEDVPVGGAYTASVSLGVTGRRSTLMTNASYSHLPYYTIMYEAASSLGGLGGALDFAAADEAVNRVTAGATLQHQLGRFTSGAASYSRTGGLFADQDRGASSNSASLSIDREWSRSLRSSLGYSFFYIDYTGRVSGDPTTGHGGEVGVTYAPRSRRGGTTSFGANAGVSRIDSRRDQSLRPHWSLRVNRSIVGSWSASASYNRQMRAYEVLDEPIWADTANVSIGGAVGRRLSLGVSGFYSDGEASGSRSIRFLTGSAHARVALLANAALDASYIYVNYRFPPGYNVPEGMPLTMERHRVQVGVSFWLPIARFGRPPAVRSLSASQ
jgi:hypothetical protein